MPNKKELITKERIIIVGAGLAGLGCAKRLAAAGKKFLIITENVGGRVMTSPDGEVNYGAYYITKDCHNIWPYTRRVRKMRLRDYHFHDAREHYHLISPQVAPYLPQLARLLPDLWRFRRHFNKLRAGSLERSRQELIEADPVLKKYYHQRAGEYFKQKNITALVKRYLEQALWASFFEDPASVPAFIFMQTMLPLIVPSYSFKLLTDKIIKGFTEQIRRDTVTKITRVISSEREGRGEREGHVQSRRRAQSERRVGRGRRSPDTSSFELTTKKGERYRCQKLILATPMTVTNKLIKPQKIKSGTPVSFLHLNGTPKKRYNYEGYQFFPMRERAAISREEDGTYLYFYRGPNRVNKYFNEHEIITKKTWRPALTLKGDQYINEAPEQGLFLANDHNVASTEDALINGIFVGKLVLADLRKSGKKEA